MNNWLIVLFDVPPTTWGLRGDPYLWQELRTLAVTLRLPPTERDLRRLLRTLIENLIETRLVPGQHIYVPRYTHGGMSNGQVSAGFWLRTVLPQLMKRYRELTQPADAAACSSGPMPQPKHP